MAFDESPHSQISPSPALHNSFPLGLDRTPRLDFLAVSFFGVATPIASRRFGPERAISERLLSERCFIHRSESERGRFFRGAAWRPPGKGRLLVFPARRNRL